MTRRRTAPGFTLIEMVVSLAVFSMIMLATVTALRTLGATQGSLEQLTLRNDEIRSVSSFLRDALESAVIGSGRGGLSLGGGGQDLTVFEVFPNALVWSTAMRFGESAGGSYVVKVEREGASVVLRWQKPNPNGAIGPWNKAPARTLISGVQDFSVAYRRQMNGEWQRKWDSAGAPGWVRLQIQAGDRYWPDIVMQVARQ